MARAETWQLVSPYFKPKNTTDKWGDPDAIDDEHLFRLFDFRTFLGCPVHVTRGVASQGHSKKSYHYPRKTRDGRVVGLATDVVIPAFDGDIFDLVIEATRFFGGVGLYFNWKYDGKPCPGLHLDSRPLGHDKDSTLNYREARWIGIIGSKGKQEYIPMTSQNILKHSHLLEKSCGDLH